MQFNISALLVFALAADALQYSTTQYNNIPQTQRRVVVEQQKVHTVAPRITNVSISAQKANLKVVPRRRDRAMATLRNVKDKTLVHIGNNKMAYGTTAAFLGGVTFTLLLRDQLENLLKRLNHRASLLFSKMGKSIAEFARTVADWVSECTQAFFGHIDWLMGKMGLKKVSQFNRRMWEAFKAQVIRAYEAIKSVGNRGIDASKTAMSSIGSGVEEGVQKVKGSVAGATSKIAKKTSDAAGNVSETAGNIQTKAQNAESIAEQERHNLNEKLGETKDEALGAIEKAAGGATSAAARQAAGLAEKARNGAQNLEDEGEELKKKGENMK